MIHRTATKRCVMGTGDSGPALGASVDGGCSGGSDDVDDEEDEVSAKGKGEHWGDEGTLKTVRHTRTEALQKCNRSLASTGLL